MTKLTDTRSLAEILSLLENAMTLLVSAEGQWESALESELASARTPEVAAIEELLQAATHETAGTLTLALQDIKALLARRGVRCRYPMFSHEQFNHIVLHGWSVHLVSELSRQHPGQSLAGLSVLVKNLCLEWGRMPPVACAHVKSASLL